MKPAALSELIRLAWDVLLPQIPDCALDLAVILNLAASGEELDQSQVIRLVELLIAAGAI